MSTTPVTPQQLIDASTDATNLGLIVNGAADAADVSLRGGGSASPLRKVAATMAKGDKGDSGDINTAQLITAGGGTLVGSGSTVNNGGSFTASVGTAYFLMNKVVGNAPYQIVTGGALQNFQLDLATASDTFDFLVLSCDLVTPYPNPNSNEVIYRATVTPKGVGLHTYIAGVDFPPFVCPDNWIPGIVPQAGSLPVLSTGTSSQGGTTATPDPGAVGAFIPNFGSNGLNAQNSPKMSMTCNVGLISLASPSYVQDYVNTQLPLVIDSKNFARTANKRLLVYDKTFSGSGTVPTDWQGAYPADAANWSLSSGLLTPLDSVNQFKEQLYQTTKYFAASERTYRYYFQINVLPAKVGIGTLAQGSNVTDFTVPSLFWMDTAAATLNVGNAPDTGSLTGPGVNQSIALGFTPIVGTQYVADVTVKNREITFRFIDPLSGTIASILINSNATDTGVYPAGLYMDFLAFYAILGQFTIKRAQVFIDVVNVHTWIGGDSIVYGVRNLVADTWASQFAAVSTNTCISGRPGDESTGVKARYFTECSILNPDIVYIGIGTNDASASHNTTDFTNDLASIVADVHAKGNKIIMGLIPPCGNFTSTVQDAYNAIILAAGADGYVHMDKALSTGHDGHTQNTSLFNGDHVHPNSSGHAAMFKQLQADVPWMFD